MAGEKKIATILVIDDEKDILTVLRDTLMQENFNVLTAMTGKQGLTSAEEHRPDVILLDLRLPDMDGYDVCRRLKENALTSAIPVLILSTRSKQTEKVIGLEIGADDYLTKPYDDSELLARIRVLLRRKKGASIGPSEKHEKLIYESVECDPETRKVKVNGKTIPLTRKEFDLLVVLLSNPGKAFNRSSILSSIWGASFDSLQSTIDSHIKTLRKKLGGAGKFIETIPGIGYRWAEKV